MLGEMRLLRIAVNHWHTKSHKVVSSTARDKAFIIFEISEIKQFWLLPLSNDKSYDRAFDYIMNLDLSDGETHLTTSIQEKRFAA